MKRPALLQFLPFILVLIICASVTSLYSEETTDSVNSTSVNNLSREERLKLHEKRVRDLIEKRRTQGFVSSPDISRGTFESDNAFSPDQLKRREHLMVHKQRFNELIILYSFLGKLNENKDNRNLADLRVELMKKFNQLPKIDEDCFLRLSSHSIESNQVGKEIECIYAWKILFLGKLSAIEFAQKRPAKELTITEKAFLEETRQNLLSVNSDDSSTTFSLQNYVNDLVMEHELSSNVEFYPFEESTIEKQVEPETKVE